ncbi:MAG: SPOR domain-containing protein [Thermodesulfobacteriales bacterium]|jgi:cell division septation protein DedD|nr:MAG: SPOR domain-containing protein [Thermodesulfobacteriales bacterium]
MSNNNSGPKNSKIISLFITFAILFVVVFGLGVIIGKGLGGPDTNTVQKSYDIEAPEVEYGASDEIASEKIAPLEMESEVVVLDEDILDEDAESSVDKDSKEATADTDSTESHSKDTPQIETPSQTPQPEKMTDKSEADSKEVIKENESPKVVVEKTPPTKQDTPPDKSTMPKIDPNGRYTVQIGAFQNQTEANKLMNSLKSNGYPAFIKQVETPDNKTWYRVRVGTFSTKSEALNYGDKLKQRASGVKYLFITVNN